MLRTGPLWTVLSSAITMAFVITACSQAAVPTTAPTAAPQPTDGADGATVPVEWTTYTSPEYGYAIDYPTNWAATPAKKDWPSSGSSYPDDDAVDKSAAPTSDPWILMFVLSVPLAEGESADDRIAKLDQENLGLCDLGNRHEVTIDGVAARQEDGKCFGRDFISQIAVVNSGR